MKLARSWRYAPWLLRDYYLWGGVATFIVMMFVGAVLAERLVLWGPRTDLGHPLAGAELPEIKAFVGQLLLVLSTIGPVIATIGVVSTDRRLGYYRLFFSRPASVTGHYTRALLVNGVGFMTVSFGLIAVFLWLVGPLPNYSVIPLLVLSYIFFGGIIFLLSVLWRFDLFLFVVTYAAAALSWDVLTSDRPKSWLGPARPILSLLPPVQRQAELMLTAAVVPIAWSDVFWIGCYGLACFALGYAILRRRQLAGST